MIGMFMEPVTMSTVDSILDNPMSSIMSFEVSIDDEVRKFKRAILYRNAWEVDWARTTADEPGDLFTVVLALFFYCYDLKFAF